MVSRLETVSELAQGRSGAVTWCLGDGVLVRRSFAVVTSHGPQPKTYVLMVWLPQRDAPAEPNPSQGLSAFFLIEACALIALIMGIAVWATDRMGKAAADAVRVARTPVPASPRTCARRCRPLHPRDPARHGSGSGLGPAIARENARLLGGDLTLDADGRTLVLALPRALA